MSALGANYESVLLAADTFIVYDHFTEFSTGGRWTSVLTDSGTASVGNTVGGRLSLVCSDGSVADNDEAYIRTTNDVFLVAGNKPLRAYSRMQFTEANTSAMNAFVGFMSSIAANALVDDGGGMRTTGNYFVFFKVDGGTTWQVRSRNGTTTYTNDTGITAGGSSFQTFAIDIDTEGDGSTNVRATFYINGQICRDATTNLNICHVIPISGSVQMQLGAGAKNGSGSLETLVIDYLNGTQKL